ncbi:MAG: GNAT family N-acetyltransferase [Deltaproteobacteria bacterium]|nr:GNAT family N-acetyltransferase [Deltaproteobacteria bacterium]
MIDLLDEVIVTPRRAFPRLPDLQVIERPGWLQIVTPSIKTGGLNEVIYSLLDERSADAAIDSAVAMYRDLGLKFRWNAGPGSGPADLCERLERRGLTPSWGRGMARSIEDGGPVADVIEVDARTVEDYTHVMAAGWNADAAALLSLHQHILAEGRHCLFVGYCDGLPVAAASYVPFTRSAYLMGGVVLPSHRGRGLYRALVQARLAHARARGITLATSHAREATSAPILEKLGFETVCRFPLYFG